MINLDDFPVYQISYKNFVIYHTFSIDFMLFPQTRLLEQKGTISSIRREL